jgi:endo-1,4-beta-D-glucanase Y
VWLGDRDTFERVFDWTELHLGREDGLYSWRWSPEGGGRILDRHTAADADQDIAFALILASRAFDRVEYRTRATGLLRAIRLHESVEISDGWLPAGGDWAVGERIVNLSYFAPYAYPFFDVVDPESEWLKARRIGYDLLKRVSPPGSNALPPDFITVSPSSTPGPLPPGSQLGHTFSFDGARIPWRLTMDCRLHRAPDGCDGSGVAATLAAAYASSGRIVTEYSSTARPLTSQQSPTFYASLLPYLQDHDPALATSVRRQQLSPSGLRALLTRDTRYYDANWVWFGLALAEGLIPARTPAPEVFALGN